MIPKEENEFGIKYRSAVFALINSVAGTLCIYLRLHTCKCAALIQSSIYVWISLYNAWQLYVWDSISMQCLFEGGVYMRK